VLVQTAQGKVPRGRRLRKQLVPVALLAPAVTLVAAVIAYPLVRAVWLSFQNFNILRPAATTSAGFANYAARLADPVFWGAALNSLQWVVGVVVFQLLFGFFGALLLNQRFPLRGLVRGVLLIPWATPSVLVALMWMWLLDSNYGMLNDLVRRLGLSSAGIAWLAQPNTALPTIILVDIWQGIPFFAIMILAALQTVPRDLKEAAVIDGASAWQSLTRVTVPLILPTILITIVLRIIWTANYMDLMLVMTGGGPGTATTTLPLLSYVTAYKSLDFGGGAAVAVLQAIALFGVILIYVRLLRRQGVI
jgi:multiple sugar transport system permease protein